MYYLNRLNSARRTLRHRTNKRKLYSLFISFILMFLLVSFQQCLAQENDGSKQPNIILILADDMGYSDIGSYGGEIKTPNLDALAQEGVRFSQFYNAARCCPSRASLLTGLYPHQTGFGFMDGDLNLPGYEGYLNDQCLTIAEVLKLGGYETMMCGKWHLGKEESHRPTDRGFDHFYGTLIGAGSYFDPATLMYDNQPIKAKNPGYYYTDAISDTAVQFIQRHQKIEKDKPFFLYVSYTAPHWPLHAPENIIKKYKGVYDKGWDTIRAERYKRMVKMGLINPNWGLSPRGDDAVAWQNEPDKPWRERSMEVYAAQVDDMDQGIGRILSALKNTGQIDNTLILFLSDNGGCSVELKETSWLLKNGALPEKAPDGTPMHPNSTPEIMPGAADTYAAYGIPWAKASNTPFRKYKSYAHEGGIATPFIAWWPNKIKQKNVIVHQPAHILDVMKTCVEVAGIDYPTSYKGKQVKPLEGESLLPLIQGRNQPIHDALYWEHAGKRAVRKGKWKLVSINGGAWELYDMEKDRTELHNLKEEFPQKVRELEQSYKNWAKRCGVVPYEEFERVRHQK